MVRADVGDATYDATATGTTSTAGFMIQTILSCFIAGVSHAKPNFDELNAEDQVVLVPEPHNEFDPKAIRVVHIHAGKLGFVPKEMTCVLHDAWRNKIDFVPKIVSANNDGKWPKIWLQVIAAL